MLQQASKMMFDQMAQQGVNKHARNIMASKIAQGIGSGDSNFIGAQSRLAPSHAVSKNIAYRKAANTPIRSAGSRNYINAGSGFTGAVKAFGTAMKHSAFGTSAIGKTTSFSQDLGRTVGRSAIMGGVAGAASGAYWSVGSALEPGAIQQDRSMFSNITRGAMMGAAFGSVGFTGRAMQRVNWNTTKYGGAMRGASRFTRGVYESKAAAGAMAVAIAAGGGEHTLTRPVNR